MKTVLGDELGALALQGPMLFTTSDRQYVHYRELLNESAVVPSVIPYKSHYALDDAAWIDSKYPQTAPRPLQLMFHGSTGRGSATTKRSGYTEGALRGLMCEALRASFGANSSLHCMPHYAAAASATSLLQTSGLLQTQLGEAQADAPAQTADAPGQTGGAQKGGAQKGAGPAWIAVTSGRRASLQTVAAYTLTLSPSSNPDPNPTLPLYS